MNDFSLFFPIGIEHITDLEGLDHILFVAALCLRYLWSDWKKLLILITAFTIGHSITLALSTLEFVNISSTWTEFLIPVTIFITAINNLSVKNFKFQSKYPLIYFYALIFGLIHGLGFSALLKSMLGKDHSIVMQLLAFNLGLEVGQLIIVAIILLISFIFVSLFKINRREYIILISGGIAAISLQMGIERFPGKQDKNYEETALMHHHPGNTVFSQRAEYPKQSNFQSWK